MEAAAEFEQFRNERQKVLWAQSYLSSSALAWSRVITTGADDPVLNPRRFLWAAWLNNFQAAFGLQDPAQDALNQIAMLQQGSKSITDYCMAFFELKGKLGPADANSEYIKDRFWKGLSTSAMEALVNTDFAMAENARDILLCKESKLADIAARKKGQWHGAGSTAWSGTTGTGSTAAGVEGPRGHGRRQGKLFHGEEVFQVWQDRALPG